MGAPISLNKNKGHTPMSGEKNVEQWKSFIEGCLDFRPAEGVFRIARDIFTEPQLFDLHLPPGSRIAPRLADGQRVMLRVSKKALKVEW